MHSLLDEFSAKEKGRDLSLPWRVSISGRLYHLAVRGLAFGLYPDLAGKLRWIHRFPCSRGDFLSAEQMLAIFSRLLHSRHSPQRARRTDHSPCEPGVTTGHDRRQRPPETKQGASHPRAKPSEDAVSAHAAALNVKPGRQLAEDHSVIAQPFGLQLRGSRHAARHLSHLVLHVVGLPFVAGQRLAGAFASCTLHVDLAR